MKEFKEELFEKLELDFLGLFPLLIVNNAPSFPD